MPHKNTIRRYLVGGYYHVYNRGVEKRKIFKDDEDYLNFLSRIESYLTPKEDNTVNTPVRNTPYWRSKLKKDEVEMICYSLIPNHFHFILKQNVKNGVTKFMRRVSNSYVSYFNKKYERDGGLFQGKFKARLIDNDNYLLHLSRYIHLNCKEVRPLDSYQYSSYWEYIGKRKTKWVHTIPILSFFKKNNKLILGNKTTYKFFVEGDSQKTNSLLDDLTLE